MNPNYPFVARRAKHRCEYCHAPEIVFNVAFEVDHIIPLSQNGSDTEQNWALSCRICNLRKLDHTCGFDPISQTTIRLFNPRLELWHENFLGSPKTPFLIEGITAIGRATVTRLEMNSSLQLKTRSLWIRLGIFP